MGGWLACRCIGRIHERKVKLMEIQSDEESKHGNINRRMINRIT